MAPPSSSRLQELSSLFPLTSPTPNPLTNPALIHPSSIPAEEDLCFNPDNFKTWWSLITATKERLSAEEKRELEALASNEDSDSSDDEAILGPLK